jgi:hypothetical protein
MPERRADIRDEDSRRPRSLALPLAITVLTLFLLMLFQTIQLIREHDTLTELRAGQETTVQESVKLRQQLETLAGKTAQLANDGDASARAIVEQMQRQGVTLAPPKK